MVELLVVVAIIGILAELAIANYSLFKRDAYNATAASDCRNIMPAADFASSAGKTLNITLDGTTSGQIDVINIPGASSSPYTFGTITVTPTSFQVVTSSQLGNLCYSASNESAIVVTPAVGGTCT